MVRLLRNLLFGFILLFCCFTLYSKEITTDETTSLSGYVMDSQNDETLVGAAVFVQGTKLGAYTNKQGYFTITDIPPGDYTVSVSFIGYIKSIKKIKLKANSSLRETFKLDPSTVSTGEVEVEASREIEKREISISKIDIPIQQIKKIRIGGESDVFRSLQFLPGILTSSQLSSGLYVRGGSPDQNLILLDGSIVYNPTHLFGFISTFNSDAIKDVELIKGGFPAEYGGRLSAVLNITQKDGNRNKVEGQAGLGVISSKLSLQGPLFDGSWFISGRRTYFELIKAAITVDPATPIPDFNFYDVNIKVNQNFGPNDKVSVSSFMSNDLLKVSSFGVSLNLDVGNQTFAGKWTHIFSDNLFSIVNVSTSYYKNNFTGSQTNYGYVINNSIRDYTAKASLDWFVTKALTAKIGWETNRYNFKYYLNFTGSTDSTSQGENSSSWAPPNIDTVDWNHALFAQFDYNITDLLLLQSGLRMNYWKLSNIYLLDPLIAMKYRLSMVMSIKDAWGIYSQNLRLATQPDFSFFDT